MSDTAENANFDPEVEHAEQGFVEQPVEAPPQTAAVRMREFEDEVFGKDVTRISGQVERGHGSLYSRLTHEQQHHHTALEHLVKTEKRVADASVELAKAETEHASAEKAAEAASEAADDAGSE